MKQSLNQEDNCSAWESPATSPSSRTRNLLIVVGVAGVVLVAAVFWMFTVRSAVVIPNPVAPSAAAEPVLVEFEKLKGKWVRPDGGYILEFKRLLPQNDLEVAYFNPNPIHVAKARLFKERGFVKVFVELQDVNYPGSTYTLIYDVENALLRGIYYQALQQQEYEVAFERMPPGS